MRKLTIKGTFPGLNDYITAERSNKYAGSKMKKQYQHIVIVYARNQLSGFRPKCPVVMHYRWIEPTRRRDKSNIAAFGRKVIEDGLVKAGVLKNDGWDDIAYFTDDFAVDKRSPRIEVEFEEAKG